MFVESCSRLPTFDPGWLKSCARPRAYYSMLDLGTSPRVMKVSLRQEKLEEQDQRCKRWKNADLLSDERSLVEPSFGSSSFQKEILPETS